MESLQLVKIHDPLFKGSNKDISYAPYNGETLLELRQRELPTDVDFHISLNGKLLQPHEWEYTTPRKGDCITFLPKTEGGDGAGSIIKTLTFVVMAVIINYGAVALAELAGDAAYLSALGSSGSYASANLAFTAAYYAAYAGTMIGGMLIGGAVLNALFPSATPALSSGGDLTQSQYYGWSPQTTQKQGGPIPKFYGYCPMFGNIIGSFTESVNSDNYISALIHGGYGPIRNLTNFKLNDQPSSDFANVSIVTRLGRLTQAVIPFFSDTPVSYYIGREVRFSSPVVYTTEGTDFDVLEVDITFPNGMYNITDDGSYAPIDISYNVSATKNDDPTVILNMTNTRSVRRESGYWSAGWWQEMDSSEYYQAPAWFEVVAGATDLYAHYEGEFYGEGTWVDPVRGQSLTRADCLWHWIGSGSYYYATEASADESVNYGSPSSFTKTYKTAIPLGKKGKYKVTVTRITPMRDTMRYRDSMVVATVREVSLNDFTYPKSVLVGVKAMSSNQLSGSLRFSCDMEASLIRVYRADEVLGTDGKNYRCKLTHYNPSASNRPITGADWSTYWEQKGRSAVLLNTAWSSLTWYTSTKNWRTEFNNNYAWVFYDVATQPVINDDDTVSRYDGYPTSRIILADIEAWSDFCDELVDNGAGGTEFRFSFNGGFDTENGLWTNLQTIAKEARALPYWRGYKLGIVIDKARDSVSLFSDGNSEVDSFEETFLPLDERASEIEVMFKNAELDYEQGTFSHFNTSLTSISNKVATTLIGCTGASQAWRVADYMLRGNQYWLRTIRFDVDVEAVTLTLGDRFEFQHHVPIWGLYGGRVVSSTANTVTLDQSVTLEADKTYTIMVRLMATDVLVTRTISNSAGTYTTLTVSVPFVTNPSLYDPFALGETGITTKPFFVTGLSRSGDSKISIEAMEYDANVYVGDTGTPVIPAITYASREYIQSVTALTLTGNGYIDQSGSMKGEIFVGFTKPNIAIYKKAKIFYRTYSSANYTTTFRLVGETYSDDFKIEGLDLGVTYQVVVQSVAVDGMEEPFTSAANALITMPTALDLQYSIETASINGLGLFEQGNSSDFDGKDARIVWNGINFTPMQDVGAGDESYGAGTHTPPTWFKGYIVRIYDTNGVLLREEAPITEMEYTYTYEKNVEDNNGTPAVSFEIRVCASDRFGKLSPFSKMTVTNTVPNNITSASASSMVGGVKFTWAKSVDSDFRCYSYRTRPSLGGAWSSWADVEDNSMTRHLTAAEISAYTNKCTIYIEVVAKDWYAQVSVTAATANAASHDVADNLFQLVASTDGTGTASSLYDGNKSSGGVAI